jgi:hypothetical protein
MEHGKRLNVASPPEVWEFTIIAMHLPDPSYVSFVTAVISSVTATIGLLRLLLEKKNTSKNDTDDSGLLKKSGRWRRFLPSFRHPRELISVRRGITRLFKKKANHWTTGSFALGTAITAVNNVDIVFTCVDKDHIDPSNLNRVFKYYI